MRVRGVWVCRRLAPLTGKEQAKAEQGGAAARWGPGGHLRSTIAAAWQRSQKKPEPTRRAFRVARENCLSRGQLAPHRQPIRPARSPAGATCSGSTTRTSATTVSRAYLESLRWPDGASCPRCGSGRTTPVVSRGQIDCRECRYRFSVTSGTFLHDSAVPLWKWLVAVSLFAEARRRAAGAPAFGHDRGQLQDRLVARPQDQVGTGRRGERRHGAGAAGRRQLPSGERQVPAGLRDRARVARAQPREPGCVRRRAALVTSAEPGANGTLSG